MAKRGRIALHYTTGTIIEFEEKTPQGQLVHSVTTTTRHAGYVVATTLSGFVDPRSIMTIYDKDEAIAEARRRANHEKVGPPALSADQLAIVRMLALDPEARARSIDDLGAFWEWLFKQGHHDDADKLARLIKALRGMEEGA